jgi:ABC-type branched-subunit amino acid transport system ATPase component/MFS family permease
MPPVSDLELDIVAKRGFVPSEREVGEGLADYTFTPPVVPEPEPKVPFNERAHEFFESINPWSIARGYAVLPLLLLGFSHFSTQWDDTAFILLLPEIRGEFGFSVSFLLTVGSVVGMVVTLLSPLTGYLADRINRVRMLAVGNIISNGASIAIGGAPNITGIVGARVGGGVGGAIAGPVAFPLIADWYPPERRARLIFFTGFAGGLGALVGPSIAGGIGHRWGWRPAMVTLGLVATLSSALFFLLKEPVRGRFDRLAMGASEEVAQREQKPVSWAEGWRSVASVFTLRRMWYATPFLATATAIQGQVMTFYYADEFGVGPLGRSAILTFGTVTGLIALPLAAPITDRLMAVKPGRVFGILGAFMLMATGSTIVLAFSPFLWLSIAVSIPVGMAAVCILPSLYMVISMVVPARLRAFGIASITPWQLMGNVLLIIIVNGIDFSGIRGVIGVLIPLNLIAAVLIGTAGSGVERDIRSARASSMADEAAREARESGGNKMIICRDVDVSYDGTQVLFNVDFDVEEGELVALLGTNGAGKSTLLRTICGVQEAAGGAIFLDGEDITHRPPHQNAAGGVVFMPGGRAVFPSLTVEENLRAAAWMYREDDEYVKRRTEEVLDFFPILRERGKQVAGSMSGGEQQMLALGQAFLMKPRLLMIDELSLGLAPAIVEQLLQIVRTINEQGTTIVLVEQSANVALTVARRAVFMDKGEIRFDGPTEDLLGRGDLLRSVFLAGAGSGGSSGPYIASGSGLKRGARDDLPDTMLTVEDVHLSYGGHKALNGASLRVEAGQVVGIIGPNGAGKTTLFDVISGFITQDEGTVSIAGTDVAGLAPDARARLGLARSFQNARLFPAMTVRENIAVYLEQRLGTRSILAAAAWLPVVRRSEKRASRRVEYLLDLMNLEGYATKFVSELSTGSRRMVDMACVMAMEPRLLLLDEPSSGLAQAEVEVLGPVVRRLAKETSCGVLVIEHDMPLITALSDQLVAMELGSVLLTGRPEDVVADPRVVQAYLGASEAVIGRSGSALAEALVRAGIAGEAEGASIDPPRTNGKKAKK